jgi:peptidoglycan/xylan/chitin deacetylase (PgdA/CDA1 family)
MSAGSGRRDHHAGAVARAAGQGSQSTAAKRRSQLVPPGKSTSEFYVLGIEAKGNPGVVRTIASKGHKVQNHSWSHINLAKAEERDVREEVQKTQQAIKDAAGVAPTKIRPPYGAGGWPKQYDPELAKVAREYGLKIENWDIDTQDWARPAGLPKEKIAEVKNQLMTTSASCPNVLMHVQTATQRDLPGFIKQLKDWGFGFAKP